MNNIAVLYICTGKYDVFWNDFYLSAEKHFCNDCSKHYFVFTDSSSILPRDNITVIYQDNLGWPMIACYRYRILLRIEESLRGYDAMAFFNANALFVSNISKEEFFGTNPDSLVCALHPLFPPEDAEKAPFEGRPESTAYVTSANRRRYCQSAISAGRAGRYLPMLLELAEHTERDLEKGIVALWHDESHWNAFVNNHKDVADSLHILSQSYMFPESYDFPYQKKILMRDKHKHGGHLFLRGQSDSKPQGWTLRKLGKIFSACKVKS